MFKKTCSFIGHRKIVETKELKAKVKSIIEYLIEKKNVKTFLFGSKSQFNDLCLGVVSELKIKYPDIKRVVYTCNSESVVFAEDKEKWQKVYDCLNINVPILAVEEEVEHKAKYLAGRAAYVERNRAMIDASGFCVFYYDQNYIPALPCGTKPNIVRQAKSGTAQAYKYAKRKNKQCYNIAE